MNKGTYVEINVGERLKKYIEECYKTRKTMVKAYPTVKKRVTKSAR